MQPTKNAEKGKQPEAPTDELPPELDFFRYAKTNVPAKRKAEEKPKEEKKEETPQSDDESDAESSRGKRRKVDEDEDGAPKTSKQRVTAKGKDVPSAVEDFQELRERYQCPPLLFANLEKNGWKTPTGIQAHGIPMLMEVFAFNSALSHTLMLVVVETRCRGDIPNRYR